MRIAHCIACDKRHEAHPSQAMRFVFIGRMGSDNGLKVDIQRSHNQVMHSVISVGGIIQILVKISRLSPKALIKGPTQAGKYAILIET